MITIKFDFGCNLFSRIVFNRQTPSQLQLVKFLGWKLCTQACKQCIFLSYNKSTFNNVHFDFKKSFHMLAQQQKRQKKKKREKKGYMVSNVALSFVIFRQHHSSERITLNRNDIHFKFILCSVDLYENIMKSCNSRRLVQNKMGSTSAKRCPTVRKQY